MISRAAVYLLIATLLFTAHNICVKWLTDLPAVQIVFFRAIVSLVICYTSLTYLKISPIGKNKKVLLLRGLFGTLSLFGLFYCLQRVPLAVATMFISLAPVFTVIIAHFLLKERAHPLQVFFLLGAFVGVGLVKGWSFDVSWSMMFLGLGIGFVAACAYTCVRVLRTTEHPLVVIFYFPLVTLPLMSLPTYQQWVPPEGSQWVLLLVIGVLTQMAQYFMTMAYQMEKAATIMIFNYAGIFWALLAGYLLFEETLESLQLFGLALVVICLVISTFVKAKRVAH